MTRKTTLRDWLRSQLSRATTSPVTTGELWHDGSLLYRVLATTWSPGDADWVVTADRLSAGTEVRHHGVLDVVARVFVAQLERV